MRKWIGLILSVLLIIAFLPAMLGLLAKRSLDHVVADLPLPEGMTLSLQDYTFGWLNSYVAIKIHIKENERLAQYVEEELNVIVHGHIKHGPLLMTDQGMHVGIAEVKTHATLKDIQGLTEQNQQELALLFKDNDILRAESLIHLNQAISIFLKSSPVEEQINGETIQWSGLQAQIKADRQLNHLDTLLTISPVLFTTAQGATLDMAQAQYMSQLSRDEQSPWVGQQAFHLPTFYLKDETGAIFRFDQLNVTTQSHIEQDLFDAALNVAANNIELNQHHFDELRVELEFDSLEKQALFLLGQLFKKPSRSPQDRQEMIKLLVSALSPGANMELDYLLKMQSDQVVLQVDLKFPNLGEETKDVTAQSTALLKGLDASVKFIAPMQFVKDQLFNMAWSSWMQQLGTQTPSQDQQTQIQQMVDNQLAGLIQSGVFIAKDSTYHLEFDYAEGNMVLNGRPISQGEIFLLLMLLLQVTPNESTAH